MDQTRRTRLVVHLHHAVAGELRAAINTKRPHVESVTLRQVDL